MSLAEKDLSRGRRVFNTILAIALETQRITPILIIMIHYTVLAGWYKDSECTQPIDKTSFYAYWLCTLVMAAAWGFLCQFVIVSKGARNWPWIVTSTFLSPMLYVGWSFIRARPFKCLVDGSLVAYVGGPIILWLATIATVLASTIHIIRDVNTKRVYYMVANDELDETIG